MIGAGLVFLISLTVFLVYASLVSVEARRGQRLFLPGFRDAVDRALDKAVIYIGQKIHFVGRHIIKLSWYYSLHSALRAVLILMVKTYDRIESAFMANRERAKQIRTERRALENKTKNHLSHMADHKAAVELSPSEKKKLKDKSLIGR